MIIEKRFLLSELTVLAILSVVSGQTGAGVGVDAVYAGGSVHASVPQVTFVDVDFAVDAGKSGLTGARVSADEIITGATVEAGVVDTLVDIDLASFAFESDRWIEFVINQM